MPRKRRTPKKRVLTGLSNISSMEQLYWAVYGPMVDKSGAGVPVLGPAGCIIWPDWKTWADFYGEIRKEYLDSRATHPEAAETLYTAVMSGADPEEARQQMAARAQESDPREVLIKAVEEEKNGISKPGKTKRKGTS